MKETSQQALDDLIALQSKAIRIKKLSKKSSTTCKGSPILTPIFNPIPFNQMEHQY